MSNRTDHIVIAVLFCLYAIVQIVAYGILNAVFDFPDILREPISIRFERFALHEATIVPTYYAFAATGILQILFAGYLYKVMNVNSTSAFMGCIFGILAGLCQTFGFIRWVVAIPYLVSLPQTAGVSTLEGLLNAYLGMSIGEHLGSLFVAIWLFYVSLAMRTSSIFDPRLASLGLICAALMLLVAFEPLSPMFAALSVLPIPVYGLFVLWLLLLAYTFLRYKNEKVILPWPVWLIGFVFWLINILPAFIA